ncbi:MAG: tetratricopeptide repeat protein [Syntrophales bacterium]
MAAVCGFLLLAVALVFGQTIGHEFVNYDDNQYVFENPVVQKGLTPEGFRWALTSGESNNWHPLTWLSHMLDSQLYGLHAGGHHLTNVLLHAAAAILLFLVLWRMTGFLWRSAFVAVVFAVHPLRAESVAWVAERKDVLSGLFFMLTIGAYVRYVRHPISLVRYGTVVLLFALGLMAKPMLVTLPFVLLLLDYWPLGRMGPAADRSFSFPRRLVVEKLPLLALTAASCAATFLAQGKAVISIDAIPLSSRVANALVSYVAYIRNLFYPAALAVFYPHSGGGLPIGKVVASTLVLTGISTAALVWRRRFPYLFVGWFWYVGMLVPVVGLVQVGLQSMADRYTYLPQIGLCLSMTWGVAQLSASWRYRRQVCGAASALAVLVLMGLAWQQTSYWRDSESLWTHTLACTTNNSTAHSNLGIALAGRGQLDEAIAHYKKALEIKPDFAEAHNNLGAALAGRGQLDEAIAHYRKALEIRPDNEKALNNLGVALVGRGQVDAAIAHFQKALEIRPDNEKSFNNLGIALAGRGQVDEAIAQYKKALEIKPDFAEAHYDLGVVLMSRGQADEAIAHYKRALEIKPDFAEAHYDLGVVLMSRRQADEAITHYKKALEIKPDYAEAHNNLGVALAGRGQFDEAIAHYKRALEIKPDNEKAFNNLGIALAGRGQIDAAIAHFQKALEIKPDYAEARHNLGLALRQR